MSYEISKTRKQAIEQIVFLYKQQFPQEYQAAVRHAVQVRKSKANIFGSDIKKDFRHELSLPSRLFEALDNKFNQPNFLKENSEAKWFVKRFPEFAGSKVW
jgi:hypothetical protein